MTIVLLCFNQLSFTQKEELIKVYYNDKQFFAPEVGNYLEVQLSFDINTLSFKSENDTLKSKLIITQVFTQKKELITYDKTRLTTPISKDDFIENLIHIERFSLAPGIYDYELSVEDENNPLSAIHFTKKIKVVDFGGDIHFSDIVPAYHIKPSKGNETTSFSKYGYEVKPLETAFYGSQVNTLLYYVELYNTDKTNFRDIYIQQRVLNAKDSSIVGELTKFFKTEAKPVQVVTKKIPLDNLPSGDYILTLTLLNRHKRELAKTSLNFERLAKPSSPYSELEEGEINDLFVNDIPEDSVFYYVASLIPIAEGSEVKNIIRLLKTKDTTKYRNYMAQFWQTVAPESPFDSWINYKEQVKIAEHHFGTKFQMGAETDRGRVYLQYGPPNQISDVPSSPSEYPYQIWQYDKIGRFSNRRFVFFNPTNMNEVYQLLHSDMIGELQNRRWRFELNKRNTHDGDIDNPDGNGYQEHWGGNSMQYYNSY